PPADLERLRHYAVALIEAGKELGVPVVATEQYPKGLGPTLADLRERLPRPALAKVAFSCASDDAVARLLAELGRTQVIVAGMETHVCVYQSARDFVRKGLEVHVCADAVASRAEEHRRVGLDLCKEAGALVT